MPYQSPSPFRRKAKWRGTPPVCRGKEVQTILGVVTGCCLEPVDSTLLVSLTNGFSCACLNGITFKIYYNALATNPSGKLGQWLGSTPACSGTVAVVLWCETPSLGNGGWSYGMLCTGGQWAYFHNVTVSCGPPFFLSESGFAQWSTCCTGALGITIQPAN